MQTFRNTSLGFSVSYPDTWQAIPAAWVSQFAGRAKSTSSRLAEILEASGQPFLLAHDPYSNPDLAISAVTCKAYSRASVEAAGGLSKVMMGAADQMKVACPDFELREYIPEFVMAGTIGTKMVAAMSVLNEDGESFHGLSELLFLPKESYVFCVALSGTSDANRRPENVFNDIKASIRLT